MLIITLLIFLFVAFFSAYTMAMQGTTLAIGRLLAGERKGTGVQDAITPRSQTIRNIVMFCLTVFLFIITTYSYRWYYGLTAVVVGPFLGLISGQVFGLRAGSKQLVIAVLRDMVKRYDIYRRQGDQMRANAMQDLIERMKYISIEEIGREAMK
jgi:hypothetical protein